MHLKRELGFIDVFSVATGAMISSGIFILPGIAFGKVGPAIFISYFLAGLLALTGAISISELSSAMPKAGGDYFFSKRSLGPISGTVSGLLSWFSISLKTAFAIIGIAEIAHIFFQFPVVQTALLVCAFFTLLNIIGVKEAGKFEVWVVMTLLAIAITFIVLGMNNIQISNFENFAPNGINSIFFTAGFVFVSYGGLLQIASIAEEVKNPKKNLPLGLFSSLLVVIILYSLLLIITVGTLDGSVLTKSFTPIADSAQTFLGKFGYYLLMAAAMLAFISTGNAGLLAASRYPFALSRDKLLPKFMAVVNKKTGTPIIAILATTAFISLSILMPLEILVKSASMVVILTYILSHLAIIILRESRIQNYQPSFSSPFYPWIQLIGVILFILLIIDMGLQVILISFGLVVFGILFYFAYGRLHSSKEFALVHLLARITNKKIAHEGVLEKELKEILHHRDEVAYDQFDHLVEKSEIVDIEETLDYEALFLLAAQIISSKVGLSKEKVLDFLIEREQESSTAIHSFVAIPHIIIEEENLFDVLIFRSQKGVYFNDTYPSVKAIFVLYGSTKRRNFHLQALAAIAQIVQSKHFEEHWEKAKSSTNLRDILLLADRRRFIE